MSVTGVAPLCGWGDSVPREFGATAAAVDSWGHHVAPWRCHPVRRCGRPLLLGCPGTIAGARTYSIVVFLHFKNNPQPDQSSDSAQEQ
jgi:hypothetical protein